MGLYISTKAFKIWLYFSVPFLVLCIQKLGANEGVSFFLVNIVKFLLGVMWKTKPNGSSDKEYV